MLFCKFQGQDLECEFSLAKEDFALVIQNPFQKTMAQKFVHKGISVDLTHGTTSYDFTLSSIAVVDEFGEGVPIAWLLCNHENFTHKCLFFSILKENCGDSIQDNLCKLNTQLSKLNMEFTEYFKQE